MKISRGPLEQGVMDIFALYHEVAQEWKTTRKPFMLTMFVGRIELGHAVAVCCEEGTCAKIWCNLLR